MLFVRAGHNHWPLFEIRPQQSWPEPRRSNSFGRLPGPRLGGSSGHTHRSPGRHEGESLVQRPASAGGENVSCDLSGQAAAAQVDGGKPARVLVVDDDPSIRRLCSFSLQLAGIEVLEAEDGQRGLEQARCERPDLVLMDVMMPGLDGFELAAALRGHESTRAIPFMFLSGEPEKENGRRASELGALAYLTKPFSPTELAARIARVLAPSVEPAR